jgi:predicted DNA-binding transcriptional regulator AlpA
MEKVPKGDAGLGGAEIAAMQSLMARLGLDSALVGVPKLARLLGMGASTLYAYIRVGTFFLPYRLVNGTPMVRVDDVIAWYRDSGSARSTPDSFDDLEGKSPGIQAPVDGRLSVSGGHVAEPRLGRTGGRKSRLIQYGLADVAAQKDADAVVDGLVASVLGRLRRSRGGPPSGGGNGR